MESRGFRDVPEYAAFEDDAVGEALGDEVWKIDGGVDADGCEGCTGVCTLRESGLGEDAEVREKVFKPRVCGEQVVEPRSGWSFGIFVAVVDDAF